MADKKEVSILLLGIVAILAIVGLVLLFTSPAATGKLGFQLPAYSLPPGQENPAPIGYSPSMVGGEANQGRGQSPGNAILIPYLEGINLARCFNGALRTREMGNVPYVQKPGYDCAWFYCPSVAESGTADSAPILACSARPVPYATG